MNKYICRSDYNGFIRRYQRDGIAKPFVDFIAQRVLESEKEIARLLHVALDS